VAGAGAPEVVFDKVEFGKHPRFYRALPRRHSRAGAQPVA
jgi:hypothetical protein